MRPPSHGFALLLLLGLRPGALARYITCSKLLLLGQPYTSPYHAGDLPLCIQLKETQGVELRISVVPPMADMCFTVQSTSSMHTGPRRCLDPADRGHVALHLPPSLKEGIEGGVQQHYVVISAAAAQAEAHVPAHGSAHASPAPVITTVVLPLQDDPQTSHNDIPSPAFIQAASRPSTSPPSPCPSAPVARECIPEEGKAIDMCREDAVELQRSYPNCRANNCSADVMGCLLSYKSQLRSADCSAAVAGVAECCPHTSDSRCSEQEDEASLLCQADAAALQRALPSECWATNCEADMLNCLLEHGALIRDAKCATAVRAVSACAKGALDLLGPMVVAAYLLLATASVVLLCTMLRCCCRCLCSAPGLASLQEELNHSEDEGGTEDDEIGSVTPLPSGVKQKDRSQEEEENGLPSYGEAVEGAAIALQTTLQTTSSSLQLSSTSSDSAS